MYDHISRMTRLCSISIQPKDRPRAKHVKTGSTPVPMTTYEPPSDIRAGVTRSRSDAGSRFSEVNKFRKPLHPVKGPKARATSPEVPSLLKSNFLHFWKQKIVMIIDDN